MNVKMRITEPIYRPRLPMHEPRIDHIARRPICVLITYSDASFHPSLDISHRFLEGFLDHLLNQMIPAFSQVNRNALRYRETEIITRCPLLLCPDRQLLARHP